MSDLCLLCDYRTVVNEARDLGSETWLVTDQYGVSVFVIPQGQKARVRLERDGTYGVQRKVWYHEIPEECECEEHVKLKHPASSWKPDEAEPEPPPRVEVEERSAISLV
jgi:hypothetical protein